MRTAPVVDDAIDRYCELANIGAGHAAGALASMMGRPIRMRVPQVVHPGVSETRDLADLGAAIFFDVIGGVGGHFVVLLGGETCRELVRTLLGDDSLDSEEAVSALSEVGNVLASHALSAVADQLGSLVLPSIPDVVLDTPDAAFRDRVGDPSAQIENTLEDHEGQACGVLVWAPRPA